MGAYFDNDSWKGCPKEIPVGFLDWIQEELLPRDKVLLYHKGGMVGDCYACGKHVESTYPIGRKFVQNRGRVPCPECGEMVLPVLDFGASFYSDYVCNVCMMQVSDDGTAWFRFFHVPRSAPGSREWEAHLAANEYERHAIHGKEVARWLKEYKYGMGCTRVILDFWERAKNTHDVYEYCYHFFVPEDAKKKLKSTSLRWERCDEYVEYSRAAHPEYGLNPVIYLHDFARYEIIEKLWNAGYKELAWSKIHNLTKENRNCLLWNQKTFKAAFRFPIRFLKSEAPDWWTPWMVERLRQIWHAAEPWAVRDDQVLELFRSDVPLGIIIMLVGHVPATKIIRYWEVVLHKRNGDIWADHIRTSVALGRKIEDPAVSLPKDVMKEHQRMIEAQRAIEKEKRRQQRESQRGVLDIPFEHLEKINKRLSYEEDELIIRPAASAFELMEEGDSLHHCVFGYAKRMAEGKVTIMLIRRKSAPGESFYTLELTNNKIVQCRTLRNKSYEKDREIYDFVMRWYMAKVEKRTGASAA